MDENLRTALRSILVENATSLRLKADDANIDDTLARMISIGVGRATDGSIGITNRTTGAAPGMDILEYIPMHLKKVAPQLFDTFEAEQSIRPGYKPDGTKMDASARLYQINEKLHRAAAAKSNRI